jgi:hypothetical protein
MEPLPNPEGLFLIKIKGGGEVNTLTTAVLTDPYDKVSTCIMFTIDDITAPFALKNVTIAEQQYTFSLWLMSEADASLSVHGNKFISTNAWTKHFVTFTASGTDLWLNFNVPGIYYMYHPQLEIGNKNTDWRPAPEDHAEEMETRFSIENDKIQAQFTIITESVNELGEVVKEKYSKTIVENENGISITDSNGVYEIQLDNVEGVMIRKNGEIRSQLKDDNFYTGNIVVEVNERAQLGDFAFIPRSDGSLSFLKVGG